MRVIFWFITDHKGRGINSEQSYTAVPQPLQKKTSNLSQTRWLWTATDHLTLDGWRESLADDPPIVHNSFSRVFAVSVLVVSAHFYRANLVCIYANQRAIRENNPNSLDATIRQWSFDNRAGKMLLHLWTLFGVIVCVLVRENSAALKGDNTFWRRGGSRSVLAKATRSTRIGSCSQSCCGWSGLLVNDLWHQYIGSCDGDSQIMEF